MRESKNEGQLTLAINYSVKWLHTEVRSMYQCQHQIPLGVDHRRRRCYEV